MKKRGAFDRFETGGQCFIVATVTKFRSNLNFVSMNLLCLFVIDRNTLQIRRRLGAKILQHARAVPVDEVDHAELVGL